eukprot:comp18786_c0_seq2/m.20695 comp18786_c0_seq2/g.20695  ORF comp18786_c0_seq2/g.20695 comp18786_c0_seq2/m.20695 type:complete len:245 (-) comp18786_c0_seq2:120-854(-)
MWHQARAQERKLRGMMIDYKKRAERKKSYYSKLQKLDPFQMLRVQGLKIELQLDPANRDIVESGKNLMPWQGQEDNMIDRFDARVNLDYIREEIPLYSLSRDPEEEARLNFMRYRDIVKAQRMGLGEKEHLDTIEFNETNAPAWGSRDKEKTKEKKEAAVKKAAIGFSYDEGGEGGEEDERDSEEEEEEEDEINELSASYAANASIIAKQLRMTEAVRKRRLGEGGQSDEEGAGKRQRVGTLLN